MNTATDTLVQKDAKSSGGVMHGQSATDLVGYYGTTPIDQPSGAGQAIIVDASGGTGAATNGVLTLTGTYNSVILGNALATVIAQSNAIRLALVNLGLIKGSA